MPYFDHNSLSFYYIQTGNGMPFIFQHGLGGNVDQIVNIYLPPPGVQLITFDFRGHGKTPMGPGEEVNFKTFAEDISALMDYLDLNRAVIGGISMGTSVSLNFALRYPDKVLGLILSRPAWVDAPMQQKYRDLYGFIAKLIKEHGPSAGRRLFMASEVYTNLLASAPPAALSLSGLFNYEKALETAEIFDLLPADAPSG